MKPLILRQTLLWLSVRHVLENMIIQDERVVPLPRLFKNITINIMKQNLESLVLKA